MAIGTAGEIAGVTARIKELTGLLATGHCSSASDWANRVQTPAAVITERRTYRQQVEREIKVAKARLGELNKNRPHEFIGFGSLFLGGLAVVSVVFCAATRNTGLDTLGQFAAGTYGATVIAVGASNTRWQGRKGLGLEVGE
jgi:hypothetical protein